MRFTQTLNMKIPEGGDPIDIADITGNFDTLDEEVNKKANSSGGDISNTTIKTVDTIATEFPVPSAGESSKTFLGKVRKFIQDFIAIKDTLLTLSKLVNNGQTTAAGFALDARYGKTLYDLYAQLNSNLGYEYDMVTGTFSVPTDYLMSICNIWLPPGTYIINSSIRLTLTTTSRVDRYLKIGDEQDGRGSASLVLAAGFQLFTHSCVIKISDSSKNVVLQARHFNGAALPVEGWMFATRIK